jgi:hypothetical protein
MRKVLSVVAFAGLLYAIYRTYQTQKNKRVEIKIIEEQ